MWGRDLDPKNYSLRPKDCKCQVPILGRWGIRFGKEIDTIQSYTKLDALKKNAAKRGEAS